MAQDDSIIPAQFLLDLEFLLYYRRSTLRTTQSGPSIVRMLTPYPSNYKRNPLR
ncbi:hypothetical protein DICSQDRAFT_136398 [Dichomitus squalens LYAD-421 SS1]|uniref:Uncharacterized protein n=1 Tax=Dichomitus squalens (strain LYAD-421) TaxID=732165 RepID=R7T1N8_DICSQ|nr:uncharacterized protein DICSQDRAFT_136398 [Dichomitus squalens LYAD-421 SS1]EJF61875.1 hypothetical protein DICSQDRAFT_136398 [Dichomitus squalens LYAD-421 SS1]